MDEEKFNKLLKNCEIDGERLVIKSGFAENVEFIKNAYHFNILKDIRAVENPNQGIELLYTFFTEEDEEDLVLSFHTEKEAESISPIFEIAESFENEISAKYGVNFR